MVEGGFIIEKCVKGGEMGLKGGGGYKWALHWKRGWINVSDRDTDTPVGG